MAEQKRERFERIRALRCIATVNEQLIAGYSPNEVARYIQAERGEYLDVQRDSLARLLRGHRQTLIGADVVLCNLPATFSTVKREFSDRLEELRRLDRMVEQLEYRFDLACAKERLTGVASPVTDRMAHELREAIIRMHSVKMDLGLSGSRDLGTMTISEERMEAIRAKYGDEAAKAYADPVSRARVLAALNAMREVARLRANDGQIIDINAGRAAVSRKTNDDHHDGEGAQAVNSESE